MKSPLKLRIRTQVLLFVLISSLSMVIIQIFYYQSFSSLSNKHQNEYFSNLVSQIENQIALMDSELDSISNFLTTDSSIQSFILEDNPLLRYRQAPIVYSLFDVNIQTNHYLEDIRIVDYNGKVLSRSNPRLFAQLYAIAEDYAFKENKPLAPIYTDVYRLPSTKEYYFATIHPIYNGINLDRKQIGKLMLTSSLGPIQNIMDSLNIEEGSSIYLVDNKDTIICSSNHNHIGEKESTYLRTIENMEANFLEKSLQAQPYEWKIKFLASKSSTTSDLLKIVYHGIGITLLLLFIIWLIGILLISSIGIPISNITSQLKKIGSDNYKGRLKIESTNELGIIIEEINNMLKRQRAMTKKIFHTQDQLYTLQLQKREAEFASLQSQINPHFLYNTLECIRSIGVYHNIEEIQKISTSMAKIFRYSIKGSENSTLQKEINCIVDYISIMNIRYMDKFILDIVIDESLMTLHMHKMTLQPLVENSILHGLDEIFDKGIITLTACMTDNKKDVIITLYDNGIGISQDTLESLDKKLSKNGMKEPSSETLSDSVGLYNINQRIKLSCGNEYGLTIQNHPPRGTIVTLLLPNIREAANASE